MKRPLPALIMALTLVGGWLSACRSPEDVEADVPPAEVRLTMSEYKFQGPLTVGAAATTFRTLNEGREAHDLTLIAIPGTLETSLDEQLRSDRRLPVLPIARLKPREPGQSGFFAVDLEPGRYGIICFVRTPDGISHAAKGMSREFTVR